MGLPWIHRVFLLLCLSLLPAVAALNCYSHDGVLANSSEFYDPENTSFLIPCGDESGPVTCCFKSQFCSKDLLCHDYNGIGIYRQYCSDPDWPEGKCSQLCPDNDEAGIQVTPCDNTNTTFCCGISDDCCKDNTYTRIDERGQIIATGTSSVVPSSSATPTSSAAGALATTTDAAADGGDNIDKQAKLGIGLGVGLGVPLVGAIAAALFLWHRNLLAQARSGANREGGGASSLDQMVQSTSPVPRYGYDPVPVYGDDPVPGDGNGQVADSTAAKGSPEQNYRNSDVYHQLDSERNARFELGDRSIHELH